MAKKKSNICAYCGGLDPTTKDHIPPRNLFPKPRPSNLITVPCCKSCREGWSDDDEYFRAAIVSARETCKNKYAQQVNEKLLRSMYNPSKSGFANLIRSSLMEVDIQSKGGIYLGNAPAIKVKKLRFDRVAQRIIRGLFFYEKKYPLPKNYQVENRFYQFDFNDIVSSLGPAPFVELRMIGDNIFNYTFATCIDDPNSTVWLSVFFQGLPFMGYTFKPERVNKPNQFD